MSEKTITAVWCFALLTAAGSEACVAGEVPADTIQPVGPYEPLHPFAGRIDRLTLDIGK